MGRALRRIGLLGSAAIVALACLAIHAERGEAAEWKVQHLDLPILVPGITDTGKLLGISCPTEGFCLAGGDDDHLAGSSNPTGGAGAWSGFFGPEGRDTHGPPPPPGAPEIRQSPQINAVSCPSPRLCVAVSAEGDIYSSSDPLGGTEAWSRADIDGTDSNTHLEAVSCPSVSFCLAVSGDASARAGSNNRPSTGGAVLSSHNPLGGAAAWTEVDLDGSPDLHGVSCSSASQCLAVGPNGIMVASNNPGGPASAWRSLGSPGGSGHLQGVSCVEGLCVAGTSGGNLLTNDNANLSPAGWKARSGGGSVAITSISCPSASRCLAVDNNGDVITSTDPTAGSEGWSFENVLPFVPRPDDQPALNGMFGVSCPTTSFCAIAAADGKVLTSTNPFEGAATPAPSTGKRRGKRPRVVIAKVDRGARLRTGKKRMQVLFRFYAIGKARGFQCRHDRSRWRACRSPHRYWVAHGRHRFSVRAIGVSGLKGPPARKHFRIYATDDKCPCARR